MKEKPSSELFDLHNVFEVDDYMFAYQDDLNDSRSDVEVASLVKLLDLSSPKKILDLACGFGRHANRLAALGHKLTGVDLMPGFLEIAMKDAKEMGVEVDYRQGDVRQIDFENEFDRVLLMFTSFGYFDDNGNKQVVNAMLRALKPGGLMMIDTLNRDTVLKDLHPSDVIEKKDDLLVNRCSFDPITGRFHNDRILIRHGTRKDKPFSIRLYNATELQDMMTGDGVIDFHLLDEKGLPLSSNSRRIIVIARKPG